MYTEPAMTRTTLGCALSLALTGCVAEVDGFSGDHTELDTLAAVNKQPRYVAIKNASAARGFRNGSLLAGIANDETGLAHCWSEATWACQGQGTPDCGGGPIIAGSADGPCANQQGGLGMFQFDAGTYSQTIAKYGNRILPVDGQIAAAIDYSVWMVKISAYTTNAETDAKARAWLDNYDPNNAALRDQWIKTVVRYYNGCQPSWSCWSPRYKTYSDGYFAAINDPGGLGFWRAVGTSCNGSPATVGKIDEKYRALGGCGSFLGKPITAETVAPDGVGRYSVFENGSIYWTPDTGAFEVHGVIRDKWKELGWEAGFVGYPITDETPTPDGVGRFNVFQGASIYWSPSTGAHEVHGTILDKYKEVGWEAGALGYPTSDEYSVSGGRRSDFEHGFITWDAQTNTATVTYQ